MLVPWSRGHVSEPLALCQHFAYCGVNISSADGDMYFICHVTQKDHSLDMLWVFMGESSSLHITTLKRLVNIGILVVKSKISSWKTSYENVLTLKSWVYWITTWREKNTTNTKMVATFWEVPRNLKKRAYFLLRL